MLTAKASGRTTAAYNVEVLADSPLWYLRFGETSGTTAADSSGNSRNGTYSGGPTLGATGLLTGDSNTAVTFDGVNDYVTVPTPATTAGFTLELWIKNVAASTIVTRYPSSSSSRVFFLGLGSGGNAGKLSLILKNAAASEATMFSNTIVGGGTRHIAVTYDGSITRFYLDGVADGTSTAITGALPNVSTDIEIGARTAAPAYASGTFDEATFYNTALSAGRILAHYQSGIGL